MDAGSSSGDDQDPDPSLLHTAVKLGDVIRQHVKQQQSQESSSSSNNKTFVESFIDPSATTPGLMEGLAAAAMTAALLTPLRGTVMRATAGTPLAVFTDLLASSSLVIGATMSGMYVGSLVGSTAFLNQLANVPTQGDSRTADAICGADLVVALWKQPKETTVESSSSSLLFMLGDRDPRFQAIQAYQQALQKCRDRSEYQQDRSSMF